MQPDKEALQTKLRRDGILIFPSFYSYEEVDALKRELRLAAGELSIQEVNRGGDCIYPLLSSTLSADDYPLIHKFFHHPLLNDLVDSYFEPSQISRTHLGSWVQSTAHDEKVEGNHHSHWDPGLCVKALLYLSPADKGTGAFEYYPATHLNNHRIRLQCWKDGTEMLGLNDNKPAEGFSVAKGDTGTCVLFDTSLSHKRGLLNEEFSREALFRLFDTKVSEQIVGGETYSSNPERNWPYRWEKEKLNA